MRCFSPIYLQLPKGPQYVPCGKCNFCLANRRSEWTFRLKVEQKRSISAYFITLTYSDDNYPSDGKVNKRHLQLFFKRLRKEQDKVLVRLFKGKKQAENWPKIKYYACGEYGTITSRAHYHCILFNLHPQLLDRILSIWQLGHVVVVPSNGATIHYTTKYVINKQSEDVFALMSKGLGEAYDINADYHRKGSVNHVVSEGVPMRMPRYYRERFFNGWQKQVIAARTKKQINENQTKELERLSRLHPKPDYYYIEKEREAHERVKIKANFKNKF